MEKQKRKIVEQKLDEEIYFIKNVMDQLEAIRLQTDSVIQSLDKVYLEKQSIRFPRKQDFLGNKTVREK